MPGKDSSVLRKYEFCRDLPNAVLDTLAERFSTVSYMAETVLLGEEDRGKFIYLIESGSVRIKYDDRPLEERPALIARAGDIFGEIAMLSDCRGQEIVSVREESRMLRLSKADLFGLLGENPEIRAVLSRFMLKKFAFEPSLVIPGTGEKQMTEIEITGKLSEMFFRARLLSKNRFLAVRMIPYELAFEEKFRGRIARDLEGVQRLRHENIARLLRVVPAYSTTFTVSEYMNGESLKAILSRRRPEMQECLSIIRKIASALVYAHKKKALHRSLTPGKIFVSHTGRLHIVDFGVGRYEFFSQDGQTIMREGNPEYMSPEQVMDEETDYRSDIYSFGVICYRLLANRLPFSGATPSQTALMRLETAPEDIRAVNPEVPEELAEIVMSMLEKDKDRRCDDLTPLTSSNLKRGRRSRDGHTLSTKKATAYSISSDGRFTEISNRRKLITLTVGLLCVIALIVFRFSPERTVALEDNPQDLFSAMEKNLSQAPPPGQTPEDMGINEQRNEKTLLQGQIFFLQKNYDRAVAEWNGIDQKSAYYGESRSNIKRALELKAKEQERQLEQDMQAQSGEGQAEERPSEPPIAAALPVEGPVEEAVPVAQPVERQAAAQQQATDEQPPVPAAQPEEQTEEQNAPAAQPAEQEPRQ